MRKILYLALAIVFAFSSLPSFALDPPPADHLLITELQTGSTSSANEEFVELYNPHDEAVSLSDWTLEYKSATGATWTVKATLSGEIQPRGFYLVAATGYLTAEADAAMSTGLAAPGGHVRLSEPVSAGDSIVDDLLGWGTADSSETIAVAAPPAGQSLKRSVDADANFIDTDNNSTDFSISTTPEPQSTPAPQGTGDEGPTDPTTYLPLVISELLVDPVAPQTDAADEFVELYNPNDEPVNLSGYKIQAGSSLQYSYVLSSIILPPGGYMAFAAGDTGLALSNSGGRVQVLDPGGTIAASLVSYNQAVVGETWSLLGTSFAWTDNVTPNAANESHSPVGATGNEEASGTAVTNYPKVAITELLPDPDEPQTDERDEFVELFNDTNEPVNLKGYTLKTGSSLKTKYVLPDFIIEPGTYIALFSSDANISLANGGGNAQLLDPNGLVVAEITPYLEAEPGLSWAIINGQWQWTARPTPAALNSFEAPPVKGKKAAKKSSTKKAAKKSGSAALDTLSNPAALGAAAPPNWRLIAGVSALAAGYMIYELRYDIRNHLYRLRRWLTPKAGKL